MIDSLVSFDQVQKHFDNVIAVQEMSFDIKEGEFLAIMGPSGCGKTTTLRMLAGLDTPTHGEIRLNGRVMNDVKPHDRDTPLVWQSLALFPFLSARENVEFGLKMRGVDAATRQKKIAEMAGKTWYWRIGKPRYQHAIWWPKATRCAGQITGDGAADSVAGRAALGVGCTSCYPDAGGADAIAKRAGHHFCLCHPFTIRGVCHGRPGGDYGRR